MATVTASEYRFPGCDPFVVRAAEAHGLADGRLRAKARGLEPLAKIQTGLGQACERPLADRAEIVAHAADWLAVLRVAVLAAEAAIAAACEGMGVDDPTRPRAAVAPAPKAATKAK